MTQSRDGSSDDPRRENPAVSAQLAKIAKEREWTPELTLRVAELRVPMSPAFLLPTSCKPPCFASRYTLHIDRRRICGSRLESDALQN
jgi:hypothetical protein